MNSPIDVDLGSRECPLMISDSDDSDDSARSVENQLQQVSRHTSINPTVVDLSKEDDEPDELLLQSSPRKSSAGPSKIRKRETPSAAFKSRKKRRFEVLPSTPPARAIIELDSDSDSSENDFKRDSKRGNDQSTNTTQRDAELQDAELEDEYEHTTMLEPYRHPTSSFDAPELELETLSIEEVAPRPSSNRLRFSAGSGRSLPTVPNASIREERNRNSKLSSLRTLTKDIRTYKPHGLRFGKRTSLVEALDMDHYVRNYAPVRASGSINKIIQHNGRIVACSNSAGGNETGSTDAYNKAGTLISWSKRKPAQVCDLEQAIHDERTNDHDTYYSVNCVAYDPDSSTLLCSGQDRFIWGWRYNEDEDQYSHQRGHGWYYGTVHTIIPHDIAIKPGTSVFAVAEKRLSIHRDVSHLSGGVFQRLSLATTNADAHVTGSIAWGSGPSSDLLFAMTEPDNRRRIPSASAYTGQHSAFDALAGRLAFEFLTGKRQGEEGDAMCVSTDGSMAALVTRTGSQSSFLRLYDVRRKNGSATHVLPLAPFDVEHAAPEPSAENPHPALNVEVNCMTFSPDDLFVAVGRSDNRTHVYDVRFLNRVVHEYRHERLHLRHRSHTFYGVVGLQWVQSASAGSRLGLVTGGNDGCVRLWNPLYAAGRETTWVLAQADLDIAAFSLGDRFQGEHELVVGDSAGNISIHDGHPLPDL